MQNLNLFPLKLSLINFVAVFVFASFNLSSQNNALSFTGAEAVKFTYNSALDFSVTDKFSVEGWFKTTNATTTIYSDLINASPYTGHEIHLLNGKIAFSIANTDLTNHLQVQTTATYNDNNWHHFACVYKGAPNPANMIIYMDGVVQSVNVLSNNLSGSTNSGNPYYMGTRNNTSYFFTGVLDEFRIWKKALCSLEVVSRKNCELTGFEDLLLAYYNFNQGIAGGNNTSITSLPDMSANNYTGTLLNFALNGATSNWIASTAPISGVCNYEPITIAGNAIMCKNTQNLLTGNGATSYTWSTSSNNSSITVSPIANTTYSVYGLNTVNGCYGSAFINITVLPLPVVNATTSNSVLCKGETCTLTASGGANTYTWNGGSQGANLIISPTITTNYTVTGTDGYGCQNSAVISQSVTDCTNIQSIENKISEISIFPNPSKGVFKINISNSGYLPDQIEIYNCIGESVLKIKNINASLEIDLNSKSNGIYFIRIYQRDKFVVKKIVIE